MASVQYKLWESYTSVVLLSETAKHVAPLLASVQYGVVKSYTSVVLLGEGADNVAP